ncbi:hypothetical protein PQR66_08675 [Paraburkholderia agricolaris]|uniref:Uncharacterized protein n=1 Tax=Paraburkholderia agricolaris TaxID=2152888 RepID=A0ABW8ZJN3_9BURK
MNSLPDLAAAPRRAWLRKMQDGLMPVQSDFEKSLAFRLSLIVAAVVIGLSLFSPPPTSDAPKAAVRATV